MAVDVSSMIDALVVNKLLDAGQIAALNTHANPEALARELVARGWITRFQAKRLLRGTAGTLNIGPYRLLERLGSGGMGQVFKAIHVPMARVVALKIVRPELIADGKMVKRFRREVQAAAQLNHPNIVTVFDAAQTGDTHFLAMEYVDGVDLSVLVRSSGPLPLASACDYIRQAALGLAHAHDRGLIHRDVKPSNLLVSRHSPAVVKILDLGLARPALNDGLKNDRRSSLTLDGVVIGTPDFMAPEQARNASSIDHRADIYSLGCTLYYILTGRLPFPDGLAMEKLVKHQKEQPYPVELLRLDCPPALCAVLLKMMAKNRDERYLNTLDICQALTPFCADNGAPEMGLRSDDANEQSASSVASSPFDFDSTPEPTVERVSGNLTTSAYSTVVLAVVGGLLLGLLLTGLAAFVAAARP